MTFKLYIPIWFYSNIVTYILIFIKYHLYIPIWFYSNFIVISFSTCSDDLYIPIWFYSNKIETLIIDELLKALHSNLVLFKFDCPYLSCLRLSSLHSNLVLFKFRIKFIKYKFNLLYIPIWFYSNKCCGLD